MFPPKPLVYLEGFDAFRFSLNITEQLADLTAPLWHRNPEPYTMPCAAREQCLIQDRTPPVPDGHLCRGVCVGRLHGRCGEVEDPDNDEPMHRICQTCAIAKATATGSSRGGKSSSAGKCKADNTRGRGNIGTSKKHASDAVQTWTGLEEQEEFATALLQDSQDELMAKANKTHVVEDPSDDELEDGETVGSPGDFFGPLEHFALSCGYDEAGNLLRRARMSFIRDFPSKPGRQADMREFAQA